MKTWIFIALVLLSSSCKFPNLTSCSGAKPGAKVVSVGGCDHNGNCGATLSDGGVVIGAYLPTIGSVPFGFGCHAQ